MMARSIAQCAKAGHSSLCLQKHAHRWTRRRSPSPRQVSTLIEAIVQIPQAHLLTVLAADDSSQVQDVFYNPIQQFNRDLSVLAIKAFAEDLCRRKRYKHDDEQVKNKRKKENKRKRPRTRDEDGENGEGPVKVRRSQDGSRVPAEDAVVDAIESEQTSGETRQSGVGEVQTTAETTDDTNGVTVTGQASGGAGVDETITNGTTHENDTVVPEAQNRPPWKPRFRILDALSATGLRALRYASEIPEATAVVANDRERKATRSIKINVEHNKLDSMITTTTSDALGHMYGVAYPPPDSHGPSHVSGKYDVVDLDPYGTAAPFIDAALQAIEDGGLLCVTCTDSGVFASCGYSEKTFALYGGMPIKGIHSHEGGLRLILHSLATTASRYGLAIEPLLSLSIDFYARVFVRVRKSPLEVKFLAGKIMTAYNCDHGCGAWTTQFIGRHVKHKGSDTNWKYTIAQAPTADSNCEHCGSKTHLAGPMWGGPLHNPAFVEKILDDLKNVDEEIYKTKARVEGMLDTALDEMIVNPETMDFRSVKPTTKNGEKDIIPNLPPEAIDHHPFFFIPSALCKVIKAQSPPEALIKGALRHAGYKVTRSHCKPGSIKTDAPWPVIWEVFREWARQRSPVKEGAVQELQPGWKILQATRKTIDGGEDKHAKSNAKAEANGIGTAEGTPDIVTEEEGTRSPTRRPTDPEDVKRLNVVFDEKLGRDKPGKRLIRYQENPRENWGPMVKARGS